MYYADWWVPAMMLVTTSLAVFLTVRLARRHADVVEERDRLLTHGRRVPADVVEVRLRFSPGESGSHVAGAVVTVSFEDLAGVRHWVTRRSPEAGMTTGAGLAEVLYDPARPTHDESIFVALRRHPALSDWLPAD